MRRLIELGLCLVLAAPALAAAQEPNPAPNPPAGPPANPAQAARARMSQPVVLQPDDVPAFPEAPAAMFERRESIPHGKLKSDRFTTRRQSARGAR